MLTAVHSSYSMARCLWQPPTGPGRVSQPSSKGGIDIAAALTTSALEKKSGVSRTTIYFYVRQGLLPEPQKTATGRSLYDEDHVRLLSKIGDLKREGYSLSEIKRAMEKDVARTRESELDLAALEDARMRSDIIAAASEEFVTNGYRGTHVMAIIQTLGINPHIFYRYFPSKLELLLECFKAATPLPIGVDEAGEDPHDFGERVARGLASDTNWHKLGAALQQAIRSEEPLEWETSQRIAEAWDAIIVNIKRDFDAVRPPGHSPTSVRDDLLAYSLIGAHRSASVRASWDDRFTATDLLRAHLFVFFAVMAAVGGEVDVKSRVDGYEGLIQELTAGMDRLPPAL
jgi:DNA-binding transcriptional MerR regulator